MDVRLYEKLFLQETGFFKPMGREKGCETGGVPCGFVLPKTYPEVTSADTLTQIRSEGVGETLALGHQKYLLGKF